MSQNPQEMQKLLTGKLGNQDNYSLTLKSDKSLKPNILKQGVISAKGAVKGGISVISNFEFTIDFSIYSNKPGVLYTKIELPIGAMTKGSCSIVDISSKYYFSLGEVHGTIHYSNGAEDGFAKDFKP